MWDAEVYVAHLRCSSSCCKRLRYTRCTPFTAAALSATRGLTSPTNCLMAGAELRVKRYCRAYLIAVEGPECAGCNAVARRAFGRHAPSASTSGLRLTPHCVLACFAAASQRPAWSATSWGRRACILPMCRGPTTRAEHQRLQTNSKVERVRNRPGSLDVNEQDAEKQAAWQLLSNDSRIAAARDVLRAKTRLQVKSRGGDVAYRPAGALRGAGEQTDARMSKKPRRS